MGPKEDCCIGSIPFWWYFNPILCYLSAKNFDFQEPPIIEMWNKCHWIWHALNPKYVPLRPFWCIFSSQKQQNMKFLPEILIFQEMLIVETQNLHHWIQHASNPKSAPLKAFQCILTSPKSTKCEIFGYLLNSPWQKMKNVNLYRENVFEKAWKSAYIGFWVCQLQCTMLELCVRSTLLSYDDFSWFLTGRFMYRVLKHCVGVELDQGRIAAYVPFHFDGFQPHFMLLIS